MKLRKIDNDLLIKEVRKFNTKRTNLIKKGTEESILPTKININDLRSKLTNRNDFNYYVKRLQRFTSREFKPITLKIEGLNIKSSNYEQNELRISRIRINQLRKQERKNIKVNDNTMGSEIQNKTEPLPEIVKNKISEKQWEEYKKILENQTLSSYFDEKQQLYKENYIKGLINRFGNSDYLANLINMINGINNKEFYYAVDDDDKLSFDFFYDKNLGDRVILSTLNNRLINTFNLDSEIDTYEEYDIDTFTPLVDKLFS